MSTFAAAFEENRVSARRMRSLVDRLSDGELQRPVGAHWTVAMALTHLAFWDRRALFIIESALRDGTVEIPEMDIQVNDILLPFLAAIPPRESARIAVETAEELDARLEGCPPELHDKLFAANERLIRRSLHRMDHLDEIDAVLAG
jgi:hypothetical protein